MLDNGRRLRFCQPPIAIDFPGRNLGEFNSLSDIAFFNGKLYGLCLCDKLGVFEISYGLDSEPKISCSKCITSSPRFSRILPQPLSNEKSYMVQRYLVECCGRLLMVNRMIEWTDPESQNPLEGDRTAAFEVFEADLSSKPGQWRCVSKLGGQALFVGKYCSKSCPAGECTGIQQDCIYFMCDYLSPGHAADPLCDPLRDSGVCNLRNGKITPLLSETAAMPLHHGGQWHPTWIFPADAV